MAVRKVNFLENETYHVYNRGIFKHNIFLDAQDYERFQKILYLSNGTKKFKYKDLLKYDKNVYEFDRGPTLVNILAYVLMPNHYHILLEIKSKPHGKTRGTDKNFDNNLSVFMKRVSASYSMYFNRKYGQIGSLFEGRFKGEHVSNNNYFRYMFSYINLNPIKLIQEDWQEIGISDFSETRKFLEEYKYSSLQDYFSPNGKGIVDKKIFLSKIDKGTDLSIEIFDWLKFKTII